MIKKVFLSILFLYQMFYLSAQTAVKTLDVYFPQGVSAWRSGFMGNEGNFVRFVEEINAIRQATDQQILHINYMVSSSPEGNISINERLSRLRMESVSKLLKQRLGFDEETVEHITILSEDWSALLQMVESDEEVPHRADVIRLLHDIIRCIEEKHSNDCKQQLISLHGGLPWRYMLQHYFPQLRHFKVTVIIGSRRKNLVDVHDKIAPYRLPAMSSPLTSNRPLRSLPVSIPVPESTVPSTALYLKSNALAYAMLIGNLAVEWQFDDAWSVTLPVYYSALNYFTSTVKFRTLCFQPELRYWFPSSQRGRFFVGGHLGLAWYNYAKGEDYRYQDHHRHTPLWGGGFSGGYRLPISHDDRWHLEFSLGAGAYRLHYDIFHNEPNGKLIDSRKRTFFGIDNAAVTFSYKFNLKGGNR